MAKTPYPFQSQAVSLGRETNLLLMDECGLGKTLVGAEIIRELMSPLDNLPSLVVCPKPVRWQWLAVLAEQAPDLRRILLTVQDDCNHLEYRNQQLVVVTHYESLLRHRNELSKVLWRVLVCDEAHRIRNRQADRSAAIKDIPAKRRVALTGTPMERTPADLWSILNWLFPYKFRGYHSFFEKYAMIESTFRHFYRVVPGCKDPDGLTKTLAPFALRRTRQEVAPWLPPVTETVMPLSMGEKQAELYEEIDTATDALIDLGEDDPLFIKNGLSKILRLQQVTGNPYILAPSRSGVTSAKEEWVVEWIKDNPKESVIIFCQFRHTVARLHERLKTLGSKRVMGGDSTVITEKDRLVVASIAAAGEGLDLPHISTAVFVDTHWSSTKMTQSTSRIQRLSNVDPKHIIYLQIPGTVDTLIYNAYVDKWTSHQLVYNLLEERRKNPDIYDEPLTVD